jgi:hypothetical protein
MEPILRTRSVRPACIPAGFSKAISRPTCLDSNWWGFGAPKTTPATIVDKLNRETNAALADARIKARLAELGGTVLAGSSADFGKLIAEEKWAKVIKFAGIKPELSGGEYSVMPFREIAGAAEPTR